ncbi:uncharacterized protein BJX67DRAFT_63693 [Aspergillus lucknowensis]|uniref:Uncharacterized protein n=1 Tax=Aspergillus lucknowensis TaxID=176173 RepID=A0ABR4LUP0_9EURO
MSKDKSRPAKSRRSQSDSRLSRSPSQGPTIHSQSDSSFHSAPKSPRPDQPQDLLLDLPGGESAGTIPELPLDEPPTQPPEELQSRPDSSNPLTAEFERAGSRREPSPDQDLIPNPDPAPTLQTPLVARAETDQTTHGDHRTDGNPENAAGQIDPALNDGSTRPRSDRILAITFVVMSFCLILVLAVVYLVVLLTCCTSP